MSQEEEEDAPFHVLMASTRPLQELLVKNDALRNDYLVRRHKLLNEGISQKNWSAALQEKRAIMECCELAAERNEFHEEQIGGFCLAKGKEQDFVRLAAMHCHTSAS